MIILAAGKGVCFHCIVLVLLSPFVVSWLVCWPLDPKVAGSKLDQGDGFLRAIKIHSTPSSRMGSKAVRSHVVRFYGM
jgi:transposase InsO family protein